MKLIRQTNPWATGRFDDLFDRAFADFGVFPSWTGLTAPFERTTTRFPVDVHEDDHHYFVRAELPGVSKNDVSLNLADDVLTLGYERKNSEGEGDVSLTRKLRLPGPVDAGKVSAKLEDGILTVTLPRREDTRPRTIAIQ